MNNFSQDLFPLLNQSQEGMAQAGKLVVDVTRLISSKLTEMTKNDTVFYAEFSRWEMSELLRAAVMLDKAARLISEAYNIFGED